MATGTHCNLAQLPAAISRFDAQQFFLDNPPLTNIEEHTKYPSVSHLGHAFRPLVQVRISKHWGHKYPCMNLVTSTTYVQETCFLGCWAMFSRPSAPTPGRIKGKKSGWSRAIPSGPLVFGTRKFGPRDNLFAKLPGWICGWLYPSPPLFWIVLVYANCFIGMRVPEMDSLNER